MNTITRTTGAKWVGGVLLAMTISAPAHAQEKKTPLPLANPESVGISQEGVQRIDAFFESEIAKNRMPGAVLAVARYGKLAIYRSYGSLNKETQTPMPLDAIFNLASMTKVMASVGALTFYEEGRLPLGSDVANWFPEFKGLSVGVVNADKSVTANPSKSPITIQDLMRHTNGLTYGARGSTPIHKLFPGSSAGAAFEYSGAEFIKKLASTPLLYEPGTVWDYGFGIDVLGLVQEKLANKPLNDVLQERVWSKVGMPDTTFHVPEKDKARLAQPLPLDPITQKPQSIAVLKQQPKFDCGGSCAYSTAADYVRFGQMMLNGGTLDGKRVLGAQTVALMTSNHLTPSIQNNVGQTEPGRNGYGFGLGVAVRTERGLSPMNGHVGDYSWNGANGTQFWVDPREQLVVVVMAAAPGEIRKIHREQVNALIYGALGSRKMHRGHDD